MERNELQSLLGTSVLRLFTLLQIRCLRPWLIHSPLLNYHERCVQALNLDANKSSIVELIYLCQNGFGVNVKYDLLVCR